MLYDHTKSSLNHHIKKITYSRRNRISTEQLDATCSFGGNIGRCNSRIPTLHKHPLGRCCCKISKLCDHKFQSFGVKSAN